jgi:hypothetical protein
MIFSPADREAKARELDDGKFSGKFLDNVSDEFLGNVFDELLDNAFDDLLDNVLDELLDNVVDELSNEALDELISDLLLASVGSVSSSRGLLFPSSKLRYLFGHDAFSSFNFVTSL